eukprot:CAMPEP_0197028064 /NCGR_PEP_ID=MMETSP1384-20130603/7859_1 /TAXON_ID=29189 /ORGANISM="Ammonia sp." /LENGTH=697 /DNA_ID=CAMNT_0042457007 /DNA_START=216 /DNA_END=2309 /DNA_ORIENTATION=-
MLNLIAFSTILVYETYLCFVVLKVFDTPLWSIYLVISVHWSAVLGLFALKTYTLYYYQKYSLAVVNSIWTKDINPSSSDWYISHRSTFGNINWILSRIFLPFCVCSVVILTVLPLLITDEKQMITMHLYKMSLLSIPLVFSYVIAWKAKDIIDAYGIRNEIIKQCLFVFLSLWIYFIAFILFEVCKMSTTSTSPYSVHVNDELDRLQWCSYMVVAQVLVFGLTMSSTYYPVSLYHYKLQHGFSTSLFECDNGNASASTAKHQPAFSMSLPKHKLRIEYVPSNSTQTKKTHDTVIKAKYANCLQTVLRSNKGLSLFMQHLVNEFATENLLFIIELVHIKHAYVLKNYGVVKTIRPEKLRQFVHDLADSSATESDHGNATVTTAAAINLSLPAVMVPTMYNRATSSSPTDCGECTLQSTASLASFPSDQPSISGNVLPTICTNHSDIPVFPNDHSLPSFSKSNQSSMRRRTHSELEMDVENDYQVIDFNDVGDHNVHKHSLYNSMAQNYLTVHSYLFSDTGQIAARIELPPETDVPYSSIITAHKDLYSQMRALYAKYVQPSCEHELNISHDARSFLETALHGPQKHESFYFNVFDFCGAEIMKLLIRTFRRFRTTGLYNAYLDHVVLKEKEVLQDLAAQNIGSEPIVFEDDVHKEADTESSPAEKADARSKRIKALIPRFYAASKHEEVLAKYMNSST